ncbi:MAG: hypothetical protein JSS94_04170 [Bacteroidetes bacterium]|nr:hypothetical protein [Bacteroidota bacterium]
MRTKVIVLFSLFCLINYSTIKGQNNKSTENSSKVSNYLAEVSKLSKISGNEIYYVSTKSDSDFLKKLQPSIITFVKGRKTTTIDNLQLPHNPNVKNLNSSCGVDDITKNVIEYNLKEDPNIDYNSVVLKNLKSKNTFVFPKDQIVSVMLYSKNMGVFSKQYVDTLKRIKKEYNIDFIILTMDGQELKSIDDIYYDSFDNNTQIDVK